VCTQIIDGIKAKDPRVVYADKEKIFESIMANNIPTHKWEKSIIELSKKQEINWAFNEYNLKGT